MCRIERRLVHSLGRVRVEVSRPIAADPSVAWEFVADTRRWPDWISAVEGVESDDRRVREGTTGRLLIAGRWHPFSVPACADRRFELRVRRLPATGYRVDSTGTGCRLVAEVPLSALPDAVVCERALDTASELIVREKRRQS